MFDWFLKAALVIKFEIIFSLQDRIFSNFFKVLCTRNWILTCHVQRSVDAVRCNGVNVLANVVENMRA